MYRSTENSVMKINGSGDSFTKYYKMKFAVDLFIFISNFIRTNFRFKYLTNIMCKSS